MANLAKRRNPMRDIALQALQKKGTLQLNTPLTIQPSQINIIDDDLTSSSDSDQNYSLVINDNSQQNNSPDSKDPQQPIDKVDDFDHSKNDNSSDGEDQIQEQPVNNTNDSNQLSSSDGEISQDFHDQTQIEPQQQVINLSQQQNKQKDIQKQLDATKLNSGITFDSSQKQQVLMNPQKFMQEMLAKLEGHQSLQQNIQKIALKNKSDAEKLKEQYNSTSNSTALKMRFNKKMPPIPKGCNNDFVLQGEEELAAQQQEEEELLLEEEQILQEEEEKEEEQEEEINQKRKHLVELEIKPNTVMFPPQKFYLIEVINTKDPREFFYQDSTVVGEHLFHINTVEFYYTSIDNVPSHRSIENVLNGIKLIDIFDFEKDTLEKCCSNIRFEIQPGDLAKVIYEHKEYMPTLQPYDLPFKVCLRIDTYKIWKLCLLQDSELNILKKWKSILDQLVIFAAQEQLLQENQEEQEEEQEEEEEEEDYQFGNSVFFVDYKHLYSQAQKFKIAMDRSEQCEENFDCKGSGKSPSPIDLGYNDNFDKQTFIQEQSKDSKLIFNYDKTKNVTIQSENNEAWIYGNFGHLIHEFQDQIKTFQAYKILVVTPSEHTINGFTFDAEILIYHKSLQNEEAILSLMVMAQDDGIPNVFLERLKPEFWPPAISQQPYLIKAMESTEPNVYNDIDLKNLFSHNSKCMTYFDPSFFWYQGGDTRDECKEPVERYVIMRPIQVSTVQLAAVIEYGFNHIELGNYNAKEVQDLGDRKVIYTIDQCTNQYGTFGEMEERQAVFDSEQNKREKFQDILAEAVELNNNRVTQDILAEAFEIAQQYKPLQQNKI